MFHPDWLILRILHQAFEIERPKGHWLEVVVHLYQKSICIVFMNINSFYLQADFFYSILGLA